MACRKPNRVPLGVWRPRGSVGPEAFGLVGSAGRIWLMDCAQSAELSARQRRGSENFLKKKFIDFPWDHVAIAGDRLSRKSRDEETGNQRLKAQRSVTPEARPSIALRAGSEGAP